MNLIKVILTAVISSVVTAYIPSRVEITHARTHGARPFYLTSHHTRKVMVWVGKCEAGGGNVGRGNVLIES